MCAATPQVFFPVQREWLTKSAAKLQRNRLLILQTEFGKVRQKLQTNVDELLVLEDLAVSISELPLSNNNVKQ